MKKKKTVYRDDGGEIVGELRRVARPRWMPSPEALARREPKGHVKVTIDLSGHAVAFFKREARRHGGSVAIEVLDEGAGIPADQIDRVFEKFYRVARSDRKRAGTGLGLAISRGFVEALGGAITAANRADRSGAVFTIILPEPQHNLTPLTEDVG